jgi:hypothetical protein
MKYGIDIYLLKQQQLYTMHKYIYIYIYIRYNTTVMRAGGLAL